MFHGISRASLKVCSIAQNRLAEAYLDQLLRADPRIHAINLRQYSHRSPSGRKGTIFVIDQCGMEMPLCECLKQLRDHSSDAKFLVLDDHKSTDDIVKMMIIGAHGYVSHALASSTLVRAIFCIAAGQLWVPVEVLPDFLREVNSTLHKNAQGRQTTTPREDEILELVRRRLSNTEIAQLLEIRVSTVKFHVSNILSKMHANNRRQLTEPSLQNLWKMQWQ